MRGTYILLDVYSTFVVGLTDFALFRRQLDAAFEQNGRKPTGPLHGLPISIKEEFDMPGKFTTWGIIARPQFDGPSKEMATVPKMLLEAGAVLFAKTNVPQGE